MKQRNLAGNNIVPGYVKIKLKSRELKRYAQIPTATIKYPAY